MKNFMCVEPSSNILLKISVCIPTFNGEKFIKEQLDSILCQLSSTDEIVVSDDGSKDDTVLLIKEYRDPRIILIQDKPLGSPIYNLERALKNASGGIIFLADQDDIWLPGKVKLVVSILQKVDLVFSDAYVVDKDLNILKNSYYTKKDHIGGLFRNLFFNNYIGATMAFRREVLDKALPFPKKIPMHDQWIGLIGEIYFKNSFIPEPLIFYRRHGGNASYSGNTSKNPIKIRIQFRVSIMLRLISRVILLSFTK